LSDGQRFNARRVAMHRNEWPPVVIALAFVVLLGIIFWTTMEKMGTSDDFLKIWAAVGPIVGVVTGLIPTYFFRNAATSASEQAQMHAEEKGRMKGMMQAAGIDPDAIAQEAQRHLTADS
jgi:hypothetical protein